MTLVVVPVTAAVATDPIARADRGLAFERLAPGHSGSGVIRVSNPHESGGRVSLAATDLADEENGCERPEVRTSGEECDADGGELSEWLDVTVTRDGTPLWSGGIRDLEEPQEFPGVLPAGETWNLDVTVSMPVEAGNDTMTDRVAFDLEIITTADTGDSTTEVLGAESTASGGGNPNGGAPALVPTAVDAGLTVIGFAALRDVNPHQLILLGMCGVVSFAGAVVIAERRRHRRW